MGRKPKQMTLIDHLLRKQAELGLTSATALGDYLGVGQSSANRWLNGKSAPSLDRAEHLAEQLGVPVEEMERLIVSARRRARRDLAARQDELEHQFQALRSEVADLTAAVRAIAPRRGARQ